MSNSEEIYKRKYEKYVKKYNRQINRVLSKDLSGGKQSFQRVGSRTAWLKENKVEEYDWYEVDNNSKRRTINLIQLPTERKTQITENMFRNIKENSFYTLKPDRDLLKPPSGLTRLVADQEEFDKTHKDNKLDSNILSGSFNSEPEEVISEFPDDFGLEKVSEEKKKNIELLDSLKLKDDRKWGDIMMDEDEKKDNSDEPEEFKEEENQILSPAAISNNERRSRSPFNPNDLLRQKKNLNKSSERKDNNTSPSRQSQLIDALQKRRKNIVAENDDVPSISNKRNIFDKSALVKQRTKLRKNKSSSKSDKELSDKRSSSPFNPKDLMNQRKKLKKPKNIESIEEEKKDKYEDFFRRAKKMKSHQYNENDNENDNDYSDEDWEGGSISKRSYLLNSLQELNNKNFKSEASKLLYKLSSKDQKELIKSKYKQKGGFISSMSSLNKNDFNSVYLKYINILFK